LVDERLATGPMTMAAFLDAYIKSRTDLRPNTLRNLTNSRDRLVTYFGADRLLRTISPGDADDWRQGMVNSGRIGPATISKSVKHAKQFFRAAQRKALVKSNPFADLRAGGELNKERQFFVEPGIVDQVIEVAPDAQWKLIIALSRYAGLRCPSEVLALRWSDVDLVNRRLTIHSPKTAHQGKTKRVIPLFDRLSEHLQAAWDEAHPGVDAPLSEHVITRYRGTNANLRTMLLRIMRRDGVERWPRLFHNMRASLQTELADCFPGHVVTAWLGNSPVIAERHYLQTVDSHYARACEKNFGNLQNPMQSAAATNAQSDATKTAPLTITPNCEGLQYSTSCQVPPRGFEPLSPP